jgi:hypothetical protein
VEVGTVIVPTGAFFGCVIRPDELRKHFVGGRFRDPEIAIEKEIAQSFSFEISVARFDLRELHGDLVQHEPPRDGRRDPIFKHGSFQGRRAQAGNPRRSRGAPATRARTGIARIGVAIPCDRPPWIVM